MEISFSKYIHRFICVLFFLFSLAACGGGGNGDSSNVSAEFSIGGSISGLNGVLVLLKNGNDEITITTNGAYEFSTNVPENGRYSVVINNHPTGQTCSVSNGSGTAIADVTNVSIVCSANTYTVSGSVSGLNGVFEVQNNGVDNLSVSANGDISFVTQIAHDSDYSVAINTQPVGQTCSVANGSGTATTNVTNVSIVCITNAYSIGGSVSGLNGVIELLINGGDNLAITANEFFNFATNIFYGGIYDVSVGTQPSGQICSVNNGNGTATANVSNVSINCIDTYSIGGSVSNLIGSLVLQNNGGDSLTITADSGFVFPAQITNGTAYNITLSQQPSDQICSISNGSGSVNASDITNITVICTTAYNIGGIVSGLNGTLVIQNNASDALTIVAGGSFTFASKVPEGSSYVVSISEQPAGQSCNLSNSSGTANSSINNITLSCFDNSLNLAGQLGSGIAYKVALQGLYAYVAAEGGLHVFDISNPAVPVSLAFYNTPGSAMDVVVNGNYAYVADELSGLQVVDISNPALPEYAGSYNTPGEARGLAIDGNYVYLANYRDGLYVIDVSDPTSPGFMSRYDTLGFAHDVAVSGRYAYVADDSNGIQVIDVINPASLSLVGSYNTSGRAYEVVLSGGYAYVADFHGGLQVIDISNLPSMQLVGHYSTTNARGVVVSGSYAYLAGGVKGFMIIDISNPALPGLVGAYDTTGSAYGVAISANNAFVADFHGGLKVIDINTPASPSVASSYDKLSYAYDVTVSGNYAYVADFDSGLQVIDISNPALPDLIGSYDTPSQAKGVDVNGSYAYVADGLTLQIIDASNPAVPQAVGASGYGAPEAVAIQNNYAYMVGNGFYVYDLTNPVSPTMLGASSVGWGLTINLAVSGNYVYVADRILGLRVVDVSNSSSPRVIAGYVTSSEVHGVYVDSNYVYLADGTGGLKVLDISTPSRPLLVGSYDTPGRAYDVAVSGNYAYVADGNSLQVIDISNPAKPVLWGSNITYGNAQSVDINASHVLVGEKGFGLEIFELHP